MTDSQETRLEESKLLEIMRENDSPYVGNADEDVLTAMNAGVFPVLIDRKEHEFPNIPPCKRIYSLYDLRSWL